MSAVEHTNYAVKYTEKFSGNNCQTEMTIVQKTKEAIKS